MRLVTFGITMTLGSLVNTATKPPADTFSFVIELVVALTGMIAALGAFFLQLQSRRTKDPRDRLLDLLIEERKELGREQTEFPAPEPKRRRKRPPS